MTASLPPAQRARRWAVRIAVATTLIASLSAAYAFKVFFARPGEAALRFVPADAQMVASIDLLPLAWPSRDVQKDRRCDRRNGLDKFTDKGLIDAMLKAPLADQLRPLTLRNAAVFMESDPKNDHDMKFALLLAVSDGPQVAAILKKNGAPMYWKGTQYYKIPKGDLSLMVVDDVLVISDTPWIFGNVKQVSTGAAPAINFDAGFTAARAKAPDDANLMLFVSPKLITQAPKEMGCQQWAVADLTIRDGGIPFNATGTVDTKTADFYRHLTETKPIRSDLFQVLHLAHRNVCDLAAREYLRDDRGRDACRPEFRFESDGRHGEGHPRRTQHEPSRRHPSRVQGRYGRRRLSCRGASTQGFDVWCSSTTRNGSDPAAIAAKVQEWVGKKMSEDKDAPRGLSSTSPRRMA